MQTAVKIWLTDEDTSQLKSYGIPLEWSGEFKTDPRPPTKEYYILETIYQQIKIWSSSGAQFAGMSLETFLRSTDELCSKG